MSGVDITLSEYEPEPTICGERQKKYGAAPSVHPSEITLVRGLGDKSNDIDEPAIVDVQFEVVSQVGKLIKEDEQ